MGVGGCVGGMQGPISSNVNRQFPHKIRTNGRRTTHESVPSLDRPRTTTNMGGGIRREKWRKKARKGETRQQIQEETALAPCPNRNGEGRYGETKPSPITNKVRYETIVPIGMKTSSDQRESRSCKVALHSTLRLGRTLKLPQYVKEQIQ